MSLASRRAGSLALAPPARQDAPWSLRTLYAFSGEADGGVPSSLIAGTSPDSFVGTTVTGGAPCGCGTVFSLAPPAGGQGPWTETVLYAFTGIPRNSNRASSKVPTHHIARVSIAREGLPPRILS